MLAQKAAITFQENLEQVDMQLLKDSKSHDLWMSLLKELKTSSSNISKFDAIKTQREHFMLVSTAITIAVEAFGIHKKIYKQFCPMANNDKGAYWLSVDETIKNPYFGEMMLKCGTVAAVIEQLTNMKTKKRSKTLQEPS